MTWQKAIDRADAGVKKLAAAFAISDFAEYQPKMLAALEDLRAALVLTDASGKSHESIGDGSTMGIGASPVVAQALLFALEVVTAPLAYLDVPPADEADAAAWQSQLTAYLERLGSLPSDASMVEPHPVVWWGIVLPLLQGWYTRQLPVPHVSIADDESDPTQRPPGIVRPATLMHNAAWYWANVSKRDEVLASLDSALTSTRSILKNGIQEVRNAARKAADPLRKAGSWLGWAIGAGIALGVAVLVGGRR